MNKQIILVSVTAPTKVFQQDSTGQWSLTFINAAGPKPGGLWKPLDVQAAVEEHLS